MPPVSANHAYTHIWIRIALHQLYAAITQALIYRHPIAASRRKYQRLILLQIVIELSAKDLLTVILAQECRETKWCLNRFRWLVLARRFATAPDASYRWGAAARRCVRCAGAGHASSIILARYGIHLNKNIKNNIQSSIKPAHTHFHPQTRPKWTSPSLNCYPLRADWRPSS